MADSYQLSVISYQCELTEFGQNVRGFDNHYLFALERDVGAAVLPVEDLVPNLDVHRDPAALLETSGADGNDLTLGGLFLGGVGDVEPAAHGLRLVVRDDDDPVLEGRNLQFWLGLR